MPGKGCSSPYGMRSFGQDLKLMFYDDAGTTSCSGGRGNAKWTAVHELFHALGKKTIRFLKFLLVSIHLFLSNKYRVVT